MAEDRSVLSRAAAPADRVLSYGDEPGQIIEVRAGPDGQRRALVVIIHGGFWRPQIDRAHARPMADAIAAAGWTVALPEYARTAGDPAPTLADLSLVMMQVAQIVDHHNGRVILIGHSAGGHLALWATAARIGPPLAGTLALAPVADLLLAHEMGLGDAAVEGFLGCDPRRRPDLDPRQLPDPMTPTVLVHGSDDAIVPLAISASYAAAHAAVSLIPVGRAGHFALIDPQAPAWSVVMHQLGLLDAAMLP